MKKLMWILFLVFSYLIVFIGGSALGHNLTKSHLEKEFTNGDAQITMSNYSAFRDIALAIKAGKIDSAKCQAELSASIMFDGMKLCTANQDCRKSIDSKAKEFAPELLEAVQVPFGYRKSCP